MRKDASNNRYFWWLRHRWYTGVDCVIELYVEDRSTKNSVLVSSSLDKSQIDMIKIILESIPIRNNLGAKNWLFVALSIIIFKEDSVNPTSETAIQCCCTIMSTTVVLHHYKGSYMTRDTIRSNSISYMTLPSSFSHQKVHTALYIIQYYWVRKWLRSFSTLRGSSLFSLCTILEKNILVLAKGDQVLWVISKAL